MSSTTCAKIQCALFINDNVDIAIRCHAEGIHVGQEDMAAAQVRQRVGDEMMIGVSVHSVEEALRPSGTVPTVWAWGQLSLPTPRQTWMFCPRA